MNLPASDDAHTTHTTHTTHASQRWGSLLFAVAVFVSAFLLFQVQPLISKAILPWFGGTPSVWTTCMLFFQVLLCGGYLYSHLVTSRLTPRQQGLVHCGVLLISLAFLIYLLAGAAGLRDWVVQQAAPSRRVAVGRSITAGWTTLSGYVRGTLLISIFVSFFIGVGEIAIGLPIAGTLIAITFFCGFIPILGAFISGLIVFLIALAGGGVDSALIMLAVLLVVHGAESIWIAPMTYRKTVALNPIATLAAVTAGAALMGIVGAIIAVPIVAFFWVVLNELRTEWAAEDGAAAASG